MNCTTACEFCQEKCRKNTVRGEKCAGGAGRRGHRESNFRGRRAHSGLTHGIETRRTEAARRRPPSSSCKRRNNNSRLRRLFSLSYYTGADYPHNLRFSLGFSFGFGFLRLILKLRRAVSAAGRVHGNLRLAVGAGLCLGGGGLLLLLAERPMSLFMPRIRQKRTKAIMMKLTTAVRNAEAKPATSVRV